jgi:hypothetical protein
MKKNIELRFFSLSMLFLVQFFLVGSIFAQSRISSVTMYEKGNQTAGTGRDYWLTMAQNYENQTGKFYALYVTSLRSTTVNIQVTGGSTSKYTILAGQVLTFSIPLTWEVTTSGIVEDKAIHVWSNDADLVVNLLSSNPSSSDGMLIIPTTGWGKEYVVGAYGSLYVGYGLGYDYPSEFCIVSNEDNSACLITPNCDLRMSDGSPILKAHVPFAINLNKGQCIQYKAVIATSCDNFDVTGTIVTSNNQIGIVGASSCANIPCDYSNCDHICDMMQPVRTWGKTYQTIPFDQRQNGDTYLVIGSKAGQTIYRNGNAHVTLTNKYDYYFRPDISLISSREGDLRKISDCKVNYLRNGGISRGVLIIVYFC